MRLKRLCRHFQFVSAFYKFKRTKTFLNKHQIFYLNNTFVHDEINALSNKFVHDEINALSNKLFASNEHGIMKITVKRAPKFLQRICQLIFMGSEYYECGLLRLVGVHHSFGRAYSF
jgi:hypothetical protein